MTHAQFKKVQLNHLIDVILEAGGDVDHAARRIADDYPTGNVQDYMNTERSELDDMILTKLSSNDPVIISNPLKKRILSLKGFWKCWGDNTMKDWAPLTINNFEEYLSSDSGPNLATPSTALDPTPPTTPTDATAITNAVSACLLSKPLISRADIFMKNKGGGDGIKPLKETKQWNTWQHTFLPCADFKDITDYLCP